MTTSRRKHRSRPARGAAPLPESTDAEPVVETADSPKAQSVESLDLEFAGPLRRVYAFAIDIGLLLMLKYVIDTASGSFDLSLGRQNIYEVAIFLTYFIIPTGLFGRTIGKWVAGVSVVDEEGNKPGVALAIPREMVGRFVATISFGVGIIWVIFDKNRQGWHDKMAGTYVVVRHNSGGPGFFARMLAPQEEPKQPKARQTRRVGRPPKRRRRRNRRH